MFFAGKVYTTVVDLANVEHRDSVQLNRIAKKLWLFLLRLVSSGLT